MLPSCLRVLKIQQFGFPSDSDMNLLRIYSYTLLGSATVCSRLLSLSSMPTSSEPGLSSEVSSCGCYPCIAYHCVTKCYKVLQLVAQRVAMSSVSHSAARTSSRSLESSCVKGEQFVQGDCYAAPLGSPVWYSKCLCKCVLHGVMKSVTFVYFCGSVCIALYCYMMLHVKKCCAFSNAPARTVSKLFSEQTKNCSRFSCVRSCVRSCSVLWRWSHTAPPILSQSTSATQVATVSKSAVFDPRTSSSLLIVVHKMFKMTHHVSSCFIMFITSKT